jgi:cell division protein FtsI/penicillin-binding protein 2
VIANGGRLMAPFVVKQVKDAEGRPIKVFRPTIVRQVVGPAAAREVSKSLVSVVGSGSEGTGKAAEVPGFEGRVAGKTGTAEKFINGTYKNGKYVASFAGYLPADQPKFSALVMVDEPKGKNYYGGQVAAPAFRNMAQQIAEYLNIQPEALPAEPVQRAAL